MCVVSSFASLWSERDIQYLCWSCLFQLPICASCITHRAKRGTQLELFLPCDSHIEERLRAVHFRAGLTNSVFNLNCPACRSVMSRISLCSFSSLWSFPLQKKKKKNRRESIWREKEENCQREGEVMSWSGKVSAERAEPKPVYFKIDGLWLNYKFENNLTSLAY